MRNTLRLGELSIEVVRKDIRNVHLSVHPPAGRVTIAAPARLSLEAIRAFAVTKLGWIRTQQRKVRQQERETIRQYVDRESHYAWGRRYLLKLREGKGPPAIRLRGRWLVLQMQPGAGRERRRQAVEEWYRCQIKEALPSLIEKWERRLSVSVAGFYVQRMRTKWGSCNPARRTIRLNTDLARKPRECLEYIVVHEMIHLRVRHHNEQFTGIMDAHLPKWRGLRQLLNSMPLAHSDWGY